MFCVAFVPRWFLKFLLELWFLSTECKMFTAPAGKINYSVFIVDKLLCGSPFNLSYKLLYCYLIWIQVGQTERHANVLVSL